MPRTQGWPRQKSLQQSNANEINVAEGIVAEVFARPMAPVALPTMAGAFAG